MDCLLSSAYFAPVQWYQKLCIYDKAYVERMDSYQKQTYRNRCLIATTNGVQALTVPVERGVTNLMRDVRISDHGNWRHLHWHALMTAYNESPFFEYYADDLRPFFEKKWTHLYDFNMEITAKVCELLDIHPHTIPTEQYRSTLHSSPSTLIKDFREAIRPKHPQPDGEFVAKEYYQVYKQKHGFIANLSILDLLFNMGPEGIFYLTKDNVPPHSCQG